MTSFELRLPSLELFKVPLVVIEILEMSGLQLVRTVVQTPTQT